MSESVDNNDNENLDTEIDSLLAELEEGQRHLGSAIKQMDEISDSDDDDNEFIDYGGENLIKDLQYEKFFLQKDYSTKKSFTNENKYLTIQENYIGRLLDIAVDQQKNKYRNEIELNNRADNFIVFLDTFSLWRSKVYLKILEMMCDDREQFEKNHIYMCYSGSGAKINLTEKDNNDYLWGENFNLPVNENYAQILDKIILTEDRSGDQLDEICESLLNTINPDMITNIISNENCKRFYESLNLRVDAQEGNSESKGEIPGLEDSGVITKSFLKQKLFNDLKGLILDVTGGFIYAENGIKYLFKSEELEMFGEEKIEEIKPHILSIIVHAFIMMIFYFYNNNLVVSKTKGWSNYYKAENSPLKFNKQGYYDQVEFKHLGFSVLFFAFKEQLKNLFKLDTEDDNFYNLKNNIVVNYFKIITGIYIFFHPNNADLNQKIYTQGFNMERDVYHFKLFNIITKTSGIFINMDVDLLNLELGDEIEYQEKTSQDGKYENIVVEEIHEKYIKGENGTVRPNTHNINIVKKNMNEVINEVFLDLLLLSGTELITQLVAGFYYDITLRFGFENENIGEKMEYLYLLSNQKNKSNRIGKISLALSRVFMGVCPGMGYMTIYGNKKSFLKMYKSKYLYQLFPDSREWNKNTKNCEISGKALTMGKRHHCRLCAKAIHESYAKKCNLFLNWENARARTEKKRAWICTECLNSLTLAEKQEINCLE